MPDRTPEYNYYESSEEDRPSTGVRAVPRRFGRLTLLASFVILSLLMSTMPLEARTSTTKSASSKSSKVVRSSSRSRKSSSRRRGKSGTRRTKRKRSTAVRSASAGRKQFGMLVQSEDGEVVVEDHAEKAFNPASAIKLLTAYGAIKTLGPYHRFSTKVFLEGELDLETGVLDGDLFIEGSDPDFARKDAALILDKLIDQGVKTVNGRLVVSRQFSLYCSKDASSSGVGLKRILQSGALGKRVAINGPVAVGDRSPTSMLVFENESETLQDTLKIMLSKSLNGAAERIGMAVGGVSKLRELAVDEIGLPPTSIQISTASGLGQNRISPKQMMKVLLALGEELRKKGLGFQSIMPVAGIDDGTLKKRFTGDTERGSVIAKTGTLTSTDGGVSALVGVMRSKNEDLYFVLFGWHGGVQSFRQKQDGMIRQLQQERGGPRPFEYNS